MFRYAVRLCITCGERYAPRDVPVREVPFPVTLTLTDVHRPFILDPIRRVNYRFGFAEAAWILAGSDDAQAIGRFNKTMLNFSDDERTLWGAYGPRLMGQLDHVVSTLRRDPDSRQAVVTTWRPQVNFVQTTTEGMFGSTSAIRAGVVASSIRYNHLPEWDGSSWRSRDIPCTVAWHFQVRDGRLNLTVFMRSHDVWLGMPYDILSFTTVQRVVASMLGIEAGRYNHVLSNLHLYETNLDDASRMGGSPNGVIPAMPPFGGIFSKGMAHQIRAIFRDVLEGRDARFSRDDDFIQPFYAAINRDPDRWSQFIPLMAANGRKKK